MKTLRYMFSTVHASCPTRPTRTMVLQSRRSSRMGPNLACGPSGPFVRLTLEKVATSEAPYVDPAGLAAAQRDWRQFVDHAVAYGYNGVVIPGFLEYVNFDRLGDGHQVYAADSRYRARHEVMKREVGTMWKYAHDMGMRVVFKCDMLALTGPLEDYLQRETGLDGTCTPTPTPTNGSSPTSTPKTLSSQRNSRWATSTRGCRSIRRSASGSRPAWSRCRATASSRPSTRSPTTWAPIIRSPCSVSSPATPTSTGCGVDPGRRAVAGRTDVALSEERVLAAVRPQWVCRWPSRLGPVERPRRGERRLDRAHLRRRPRRGARCGRGAEPLAGDRPRWALHPPVCRAAGLRSREWAQRHTVTRRWGSSWCDPSTTRLTCSPPCKPVTRRRDPAAGSSSRTLLGAWLVLTTCVSADRCP
ncbi:hypothetical protein BN11_430005 [Nostocoides australiense Ben110]|uniref:Uncharacterized protein n=1 Tax=Nostocoides australiense Ben110 TaxID=1193182 RepID=W6K044_9MICO|nr:hypothetical protein BN11_430005 [Tetrasphaera australiensis Ben110]